MRLSSSPVIGRGEPETTETALADAPENVVAEAQDSIEETCINQHAATQGHERTQAAEVARF